MEEKGASQVDEVEKVFSKFDADGDHKISSAELGAVLNSLGAGASSEEVALMMSELDADCDGYIDLDEFKSFQLRGEGDEKELREAFDLYDKDKNGMISAAELHSVLCSLGEKCSVEDCQRMISSFDVDADGFINFQEFNKMMTGNTS
ncbi:probable calcium-binding protein CML27 [Salvia miltiorrhiza]|uniref:probable calcium-binding protein CML27 n=1 Tax=Salvia miltiorrhiza TaxID=226208 RepID=UPI0025ACF107|nr:probable calcium-binding protein CML27 [Salvia miltiorrhiza]